MKLNYCYDIFGGNRTDANFQSLYWDVRTLCSTSIAFNCVQILSATVLFVDEYCR